MSNGLSQWDPLDNPRSSCPESESPPRSIPPSADTPHKTPIPPKSPPSEELSGRTAIQPSGSSPESSDGTPVQVEVDRPNTPVPNEPSLLGGLVEEQPLHQPAATAVGPSSEPLGSKYVSAGKTETASPFQLIGWSYSLFTGPTTLSLVLALGGLLSLYIYFQVLSLVATLATLPTWLGTIAIVLLALLIGVVVVAIGRLIFTYLRFRRGVQIDLEQLKRHDQIHRQCSQYKLRQEAKSILQEYVRSYPQFPREKGRHRPGTSSDFAAGASQAPLFSEEQQRRLCHAKQRLADPARVRDSEEWLNIYKTEFQAILDDAARNRVDWCAKWVGIKTAFSPNALVDTLITTYWCFVLLRDLCTIYNVRVSSYGMAALLWRVFLSAYVAGKVQDWEEHASLTIENVFSDLTGPILGKIVGKVTAKGATGVANYFMVRRLGMQAIELLQPLPVKPN